MPTTIGIKVVWSIPDEIKPILNLPEGRARLRFRSQDVGKAYVKTPTGIKAFWILINAQGQWYVSNKFMIGQNETKQ